MPARGWWARKIRRTRRYWRSDVLPAERAELEGWLSPAQLDLFDRMPRADRRHGLDVVAALRAQGATDEELLLAGLLHDAGKGPGVRFVHRVAWSLGQKYGPWVWRATGWLPTFGGGLDRMRRHAALSADLAAGVGCSPRTVELIRRQEAPVEDAGRMLQAADEAN
jgi:hypothetical protein